MKVLKSLRVRCLSKDLFIKKKKKWFPNNNSTASFYEEQNIGKSDAISRRGGIFILRR